MLLTGRPVRSPLAHLERLKFTPIYDPNPSIRLRSPVNVVYLHPPQSDVDSRALPAPVPSPTQPTSPCGPDVSNQPRAKFDRRLTIANLGTPGGKMVGFPRAPRQNLSTPKRVRFKGVEIVVPPLPKSPTSLAIRTENIPDEVRSPSHHPDMPDQESLPPSSIILGGETRLASPIHIRVYPAPDHETPAPEEFPDSPSVYSPTPPNSSVPPPPDPLERGSSQLAEVGFAVLDIGHHPSLVGRFSDEDPSSEQPRSENKPTSTPKDVPRAATNEHTPKRQRGSSAGALSWWGRVSITAGTVTLSVAKPWGKAHATAATKKSIVTKRQALGKTEDSGQSAQRDRGWNIGNLSGSQGRMIA